MSTANVKLKSRFEERVMDGTVKVKIKREVLDQIDYLHEKVGAIEWSGILVYKILEGSIEEYQKMVLEVQEILPMNVGTSGYTEYEISPDSDDYTFDNLSRVMMDPTLKMGHIHTHHNMGCFFSGTDSQELHDNAPNHNYYFSLIVNFKDPSNWVAEVAYIGEEKQEGTIMSRFKGTKGSFIEKLTTINKKVETLCRIKTDITAEEQEVLVENEFSDRLVDLMKPKPRQVMPGYTMNGRQWNKGWQKGASSSPRWENSGQLAMFADPVEDMSIMEALGAGSDDAFTKEQCERFLKTALGTAMMEPELPLQMLLAKLKSTFTYLGDWDDKVESSKEIFIDSLIDGYDKAFVDTFNRPVSWQERGELGMCIEYYCSEDVENAIKIDEEIYDEIIGFAYN